MALDRAVAMRGDGAGYHAERDQAEAHDAMGEWFLRQGYLAEALTGFERALALDPQLADVWRHKAETLAARGDADGAAQARQQAEALEVEHARLIAPNGEAGL